MSKSQEFLKELQHNLNFEYMLVNYPEITGINIDSNTIIHIGNILELIKENCFDELQSYINDECGLTPNKNYTYQLRDKISSEIKHNIEFIRKIESNE